MGILKAQDKCSVNYGIISVFDNQYGYSGSCQLNISPEFRSRLQIISVSSRLCIQDPTYHNLQEFVCQNWRIPHASTKTWHGQKYTYLNNFFKGCIIQIKQYV